MWQTHTDTSCLYTQKKFLLFIYLFYHRSPFVFFLFLLRHVTCIPFIFPCMPLDRHLLAAVSAVSVCHPVPPNKRRTCLLGYMDGRKRRCSIPGIIMIPFFSSFLTSVFFNFFVISLTFDLSPVVVYVVLFFSARIQHFLLASEHYLASLFVSK